LGVAVARGQKRDRLGERRRTRIFERRQFHAVFSFGVRSGFGSIGLTAPSILLQVPAPSHPCPERVMALQLSLSVCDYDRTRAIFDGRAPIEGCDVAAVNLEPEESFHRAFKFAEFDVSEISMSSYTMTTARGDAQYVAVPAFVSRLFRHSSLYVRTDRGIARPQDLKGKTI